MKLYHGSKMIVDSPTIKGSSVDNDYGPAFYLTKDIESAHEWACRNNSIGYVNEYEFDIKGLNVLDLTNANKYSALNWVAILMHFRQLYKGFARDFFKRLQFLEENYYIDVDKYDVVIGYRADDAYFRFPLDFIRGNITLEQLSHSFQMGNLGVQIVLISSKAMEKLKYVKSYISSNKYINSYFSRVKNATDDFNSLNKDEEGIRITDILRNK